MMKKGEKTIDSFVNGQLSRWPLACNNFRALKNVSLKTLQAGGLEVKVQFNPARIISSAAKTDESSLRARPCFLCPENRPEEQSFLPFEGRKGKKYDILVNPYPIFPDHLVIALKGHHAQSIWHRYVDLLDLARAFGNHIFFYNGPKCGASAPDHHHFQGTGRGKMPLENDIDAALDSLAGGFSGAEALDYLTSVQDADLFHYRKFTGGIFVLRAKTAKSAAKLFYRLLDCAPVPEGDSEPRFNLFTYYAGGEYRSFVVFRTCHRPHHYFSAGSDHLTMSPGCVDMAGLFITPVKEDFDKLDNALLEEMLDELTISREVEQMIVRRLTRRQPLLEVGIMSAPEIEFEIISDGAGLRRARWNAGKVEYDGVLYDELNFGAATPSTMFEEPTFILHGVTIGKNFHWEKTENQMFAGSLKIIVEGNFLTAVNVVGVEDYLVSVISSEMAATAPVEFLKAHAVISRSWVMAQIASRDERALQGSASGQEPRAEEGTLPHEALPEAGDNTRQYRVTKWYGHTDHSHYDVCADDHCQRYQGLTRAVGRAVRDAVDATWGEILSYNGEICDARFSKCCGGMTERFSTCWEDRDYPYLTPVNDPFCDTDDREVLTAVLNDYDLEGGSFYRWEVEYDIDELSELVRRRSGVDLGRISAIEPLERGESGRIFRLRLVGDKASLEVGKELEIRKILSESHLKSSAFEIEWKDNSLKRVLLRGRGWGHGVGLCQIGAAVMASKGYSYDRILNHYYPGATLRK